MTDKGYLFDNASDEAAGRFSGLETALDPTTFRHLSDRGVAPGWRCLEIGAGGGSVVRWLAEKVGPAGRVLATDLDFKWIDIGDAPNVELRTHDVVRDPLPEAEFHLIHARLVLVHLPARDEVMTKLVAALSPGGWLVLEEFTPFWPGVPGVPEPETDAQACVNRVLAAVGDLLHDHGAENMNYPRTLVRRLRSRGLTELGAEGTVIFGQQAVIDVHRANVRQVRDELVSTGRVSAADVDRALHALVDPGLVATLPMLVSAWGRKRA